MVDGVLLLVDAVEGPMPQTRFVHAQGAGASACKPIVVVNKVDRPGARPDWVVNQTFDLFDKLGATDEQLDFPIVTLPRCNGYATTRPGPAQHGFASLVRHDPEASCRRRDADPDAPLQLQICCARLFQLRRPHRHRPGSARHAFSPANRLPSWRDPMASRRWPRSIRCWCSRAWSASVVEEAEAGDIVLVNGIEEVAIGVTICDPDKPEGLPLLKVDEPTLTMNFLVNTSPLAGREGKFVTSRQIRERLERELQSNVALRSNSLPTRTRSSCPVAANCI